MDTTNTESTTEEPVKDTTDEDPHTPEVHELLARTGYKIEALPSSRVYGGPPPNYTGDEPKEDCQVC